MRHCTGARLQMMLKMTADFNAVRFDIVYHFYNTMWTSTRIQNWYLYLQNILFYSFPLWQTKINCKLKENTLFIMHSFRSCSSSSLILTLTRRFKNLNKSLKWLVWLPDTNVAFWFKDSAPTAMPLNLGQLHPKIPICLVINFQHPSNGSICRGCSNCLGLLLACASQAARNVALSVLSTTASAVALRSAEHLGGRDTHQQSRRGSGPWGSGRGGGGSSSLETCVHRYSNSQWIRVQNAEVMDIIPASQPRLPQADCLFLPPPKPPS